MENVKSKSFLEKATSFLFNVFYYKVVLILVLIPSLVVYTINLNYRLLFVMLGWGAIVCLYDLFTKRNFLRASGMIWLIGFLVTFGIAVFVNFRNSFNLNFSSFGYTVIALLLLYPNSTNGDKNKILKEISVINYIFIGMTTVLSTISLIMFMILYSETIVTEEMNHYVGWANNRLFGLYANTGYMITAIGLVLIVLQVLVLKALDKKLTVWHKIFLIYTFVCNFLSMSLENAKGSFISLAAFVFVFAFFLLYRLLKRKNYKTLKTWVVSVLGAVLSSVLLFGAIYTVRPVLSYVPGVYFSITGAEPINKITQQNGNNENVGGNSNPGNSQNGNSSEGNINKVDINRDIPENYGFLTGRTEIWKFGIKEFLKNPFVGYGAQSHREHHIVDGGIRHFHNLIVQCLVSVGVFGSLFIAIFFFKKLLAVLKMLFKKIVTDDKFVLVGMAIFAIVIMFIVNSMSEVTILFLARFSMFLFWILFGYMITLISEDKKPKEDVWVEKIADNIDYKFKKKN